MSYQPEQDVTSADIAEQDHAVGFLGRILAVGENPIATGAVVLTAGLVLSACGATSAESPDGSTKATTSQSETSGTPTPSATSSTSAGEQGNGSTTTGNTQSSGPGTPTSTSTPNSSPSTKPSATETGPSIAEIDAMDYETFEGLDNASKVHWYLTRILPSDKAIGAAKEWHYARVRNTGGNERYYESVDGKPPLYNNAQLVKPALNNTPQQILDQEEFARENAYWNVRDKDNAFLDQTAIHKAVNTLFFDARRGFPVYLMYKDIVDSRADLHERTALDATVLYTNVTSAVVENKQLRKDGPKLPTMTFPVEAVLADVPQDTRMNTYVFTEDPETGDAMWQLTNSVIKIGK